MANIIDTAVSARKFRTLITAVQTAGLVDVLSGPGPFTVFAPSDEAFQKLGSETIKSVLQNKQKLTEILTYHVTSTLVSSADVAHLTFIKTLNGKDLQITADSKGVHINDATIVQADIEADNGIVHVIDTVLLP